MGFKVAGLRLRVTGSRSRDYELGCRVYNAEVSSGFTKGFRVLDWLRGGGFTVYSMKKNQFTKPRRVQGSRSGFQVQLSERNPLRILFTQGGGCPPIHTVDYV